MYMTSTSISPSTPPSGTASGAAHDRTPGRGPAGEQAARTRATSSADVWIEAATTLLVDGGIDQVRVDVIARQIGVTRGSFYWHFKDRNDLLQRILQNWRNFATDQVNERVMAQSDDPRALIHELLTLPLRGRTAERAARIELAIRDWARRDPMARHAVEEADASRVSYSAQCFSAMGLGVAEARRRASVLYCYQLGESLLGNFDGPQQRADRVALMEQLLLPPPSAP